MLKQTTIWIISANNLSAINHSLNKICFIIQLIKLVLPNEHKTIIFINDWTNWHELSINLKREPHNYAALFKRKHFHHDNTNQSVNFIHVMTQAVTLLRNHGRDNNIKTKSQEEQSTRNDY